MNHTNVSEANKVTSFPSETWVENWVKGINDDPEIARLGKFFTANVMFKFGDEMQYILYIYQGKVQDISVNPIWDKAWDFGIDASLETWTESIKKVPIPFYQDLFGMMWNHGMTIEGDKVKAMQHIRVVKLILAAMKQV
jgi:hypothetical protein